MGGIVQFCAGCAVCGGADCAELCSFSDSARLSTASGPEAEVEEGFRRAGWGLDAMARIFMAAWSRREGAAESLCRIVLIISTAF